MLWLVRALLFCGFSWIYRGYRMRFSPLPLHMDTAFYVTNRTVVTRRYEPFRGWNAWFSGGGRLVPELVHSQIFLARGPNGYALAFRELYTSLALLAALASGFVAEQLLHDGTAFWVTTLATSALLAETQYGSYFESAEAFEVALQSVGMACVIAGLSSGESCLVYIGLGLLWLDFVLVKLTGALPAFLTSCAVLWLQPARSPAIVVIAALSVLGYLMLVRASGIGFRKVFASLRHHEAHIRQRYRSPLTLLAVKVAFGLRLLLYNPALPLLAGFGAWQFHRVVTQEQHALLAVCACFAFAQLCTMLQQGNRVWYYLLVLLPALGACVGAGYVELAQRLGAKTALAITVFALSCSYARNLLQLRGADMQRISRRVWSVYNRPGSAFGDSFSDGNAAVAEACEHWRARVAGSTLLVLGRHNQAYVLLEASYDTPLVSVCDLSKAVAGQLSAWFPEPSLERLPTWLFDSEHALETSTAWLPWLSDYELIEERGPTRLFLRRAQAPQSA